MSGTCSECGEKMEYDDGMCDDCGSNYVYCSICRHEQNRDNLCRHLYWSKTLADYDGSGCDDDEEHTAAREAVEWLLTACGVGFAHWLHRALRKNQLRLWFHGPIIGGIAVGNELGADWDGGFYKSDIFYPGDLVSDDFCMEDVDGAYDNAGDAVGWLMSLYPHAGKWRRKTQGWVRQWIAAYAKHDENCLCERCMEIHT